MATESGETVVIWSGEHSAYWRENAAGYTSDHSQAGRYTRAEANSLTSGCGPEKLITIVPVENLPSREVDDLRAELAAERDKRERAEHANRTRPDYDLTCEQCGKAHILDTSLPSEIWNQIAEPHNLLCTLCIDERLTQAGLTAECEFYYAGKSLLSRLYDRDLQERAERAEAMLAAMTEDQATANAEDK